MREIKFRAWDNLKNRMINWSDLKIDKDEGDNEFFVITYDGSIGSFHDFPLMQFTGLKDKSGVEIYEGDILSATSELLSHFGTVKTGKYSTTVKEVFWKEDTWATRVLKSDNVVIGAEGRGLKIASNYGEVIGNIHANPELLKSESEYREESK